MELYLHIKKFLIRKIYHSKSKLMYGTEHSMNMNMFSVRLFKFSLFIRFIVILLQGIFNMCIPDHNADAFRLPYEEEPGYDKNFVFF